MIRNPVLRGFNPDPSVIRVDEDYYLAVSTFEWFPGVRIHHSKDLVNWTLIGHALEDVGKLDLRGIPDSCGVWAPCLSHHNGTFYLVYSHVRSFDGVWKDTSNFLITSENIAGPWSDPTFLSSSGFDGSLFHDVDGRKWYLSMIVDQRGGKFFGGIIIQEYSTDSRRLIGPTNLLFEGSELGKTEGPHLYRRNGYYYLVLAEGGTEYGHAVSIARSTELLGTYELHPANPLVSASEAKQNVLQKAGHGDMIQSLQGDWYILFLVGRPLPGTMRCMLGRETALEEIKWRDDWPWLAGGTPAPREVIPSEIVSLPVSEEDVIDFKTDALPLHYQSLRIPIKDSWCRIYGGKLVLIGRESLTSAFEQSLLARRMEHMCGSYEVEMEFLPSSFQQLAGLVCYYNTGHYIYLHVYGDEDGSSRFLQLIRCDNFAMHDLLAQPVPVADGPLRLGVKWEYGCFKFYYSVGISAVEYLPWEVDGSILSDDNVRDGSGRYRPAFTGTFVGVCCQDLTGRKLGAEFSSLKYRGLDGSISDYL